MTPSPLAGDDYRDVGGSATQGAVAEGETDLAKHGFAPPSGHTRANRKAMSGPSGMAGLGLNAMQGMRCSQVCLGLRAQQDAQRRRG